MIKHLLLIALLLSISACYNPNLNIMSMPDAPIHGPQPYIDGWKAGCQTGMTAYSNSHLRTRYSTNVDGQRMQHPYYNKGWELGQRYCSYYVSTYLSNKEISRFFNSEFTRTDLRNENEWFTLKSDGFFNYGSIYQFKW